MTQTPPSLLAPLFTWAAKTASSLGLEQLLAATGITEERAGWAGTTLHLLARASVTDLLSHWAAERSALHELWVLAHALQDDGGELLAQFPELPTQIRSGRQFRGDLRFHYLVPLLACREPKLPESSDPAGDRDWFERLRVWTLAHAVIRCVEYSVSIDEQLKSVCDFLRHAAEGSPRQRQLAARFRSSLPMSFHGMNHHIARRVEQVRRDSTISDADARYLTPLAKVSRFEIKALNTPGAAQDGLRIIQRPFAESPPREQVHFWDLNGDDFDQPIALISSDEAEAEAPVMLAIPVDTDTAVRQRLNTQSVLLIAREQAQHLPWAWDQPSQAEVAAIFRWIGTASGLPVDDQERRLAALVWLGLMTHRSLTQTLALTRTAEPGPDWAFDATYSLLWRTPPRPTRGWQPADAQAGLVLPLAGAHSIALPSWISLALRAASSSDIGSPWPRGEPTVNAAFRQIAVKSHFPRLQPYMLARWAPANLYATTHDAVLAEGGTARPNRGLPGAHAYAAWSGDKLETAYRGAGVELSVIPPASSELNALGSALSPIEAVLQPIVATTLGALAERMTISDLVERHNAYVAQLVLHLLIATGTRPIADPFERWSDFNFAPGYVFVSDKTVGGSQRGRLVPLPRELCIHIEGEYRRYLSLLADALRPGRPGLATALDGLGAPSPGIPLFFFLSAHAENWRSVSESALKAALPTPFPLPLNCFRHRMAQGLRRLDADPELIDAILGHAQVGTATYGDHSLRCCQDDMSEIRQPMETLYRSVATPLAACAPPSYDEVAKLRAANPVEFHPRPFGTTARLLAQRVRQQSARQLARQVIEEALAGRTLDALNADEIDELERRLLFTDKGLPHAAAGTRYDFYLRFTSQTERRRGLVRRRRFYQPLFEAEPFFTRRAPGACKTRDALRRVLKALCEQTPPSRAAVIDAHLMAALYLAVECRVSNPKLLAALPEPTALRLVLHRRRYWIEYRPDAQATKNGEGEAATWSARSTVLRLPISRSGAAYLVRAQQRAGRLSASEAAKQLAEALEIEGSGGDIALILHHVAELIDQANAIELPGLLAAYLAGRVTSYSLGWHDRVRVDSGKLLQLDKPKGEEAGVEDLTGTIAFGDVVETDRNVLHGNARRFFAELRELLAQHHEGPRTNARRQLVRAVENIVDRHTAHVSDAILMIGQWVGQLARTVHRISSVARYLSALSSAATEVWYDVDLGASDEEGLTDLYGHLLESRPARDLSYVGAMLRRFHAFAREARGLSDPNWSELGIPATGELVSPGVILNADYLDALQLLGNAPLPAEDRTNAQAVLVLCYRFGLRVGEAFGLLRADWVEAGELTIVLVESNSIRKLKRTASRRRVPLLFQLEKLERDVLNRVLTRHEALTGDVAQTPLLGDLATNRRLQRVVHAHLISALRAATANPGITLHHARHSFANRAFSSVAAVHGFVAPTVALAAEPELPPIVLGHNRPTRRALWGVSRLLGHASPDTTLKSYLHCLEDWVDQYIEAPAKRIVRGEPITDANIDALPRVPRRALPALQNPLHSPTLIELLHVARLVGRGYPLETAEQRLELNPDSAAPLLDALIQLNWSDDGRPGFDFLRRITNDQWKGLLSLTAQHETSETGIVLADILPLVGRTRQLLMARERDFQLIRRFIDAISIPTDRYVLTATDLTKESLITYANQYGFVLKSRSELAKTGTRLEIDPLSFDGGVSFVRHRCALLFQESDEGQVRNRIGLILLLLALASSASR